MEKYAHLKGYWKVSGMSKPLNRELGLPLGSGISCKFHEQSLESVIETELATKKIVYDLYFPFFSRVPQLKVLFMEGKQNPAICGTNSFSCRRVLLACYRKLLCDGARTTKELED